MLGVGDVWLVMVGRVGGVWLAEVTGMSNTTFFSFVNFHWAKVMFWAVCIYWFVCMYVTNFSQKLLDRIE